MKKILYHGSEVIVEKPEYGKGARTNDYGRGFYCTEELELAKEWACAKGRNGYANRYEMELEKMKILNLNSSDYHILNWLALLADNRTYWQRGSISEEAKRYIHDNFLPDISEYDVIIGYRADDSCLHSHRISSQGRFPCRSFLKPCAWESWGNRSC